MGWKSKYLILLFMVIFHQGLSQNKDEEKEKQIEQAIESIAESDEVDITNSVILEDITKNAEHQININMASAGELEQLNVLDFRQIQNIILYRKQNGYFVSNYELAAVEGMTPEVIESLTPFITFNVPSDSIAYSRKGVYQRVILRVRTAFPQAKGYSSVSESKGAVYPGSQVSLYSRYHLEIPGKFEFGLITDNDAGEELFKGSNKIGFDYYSGFISWKGRGFLKQVTVGDYLLRFGQGVNYWTGSGLGKSGNVLGIMKSGQGIRPYTSTDENRFFRGISTMMGCGPFKLILFYSNKNRDANIISDPEANDWYFTSLQTSGYHRTISEIEDEKSVNEQIAGGYSELRFRKFRVGTLFVFQQFGLPMEAGTSPYKAKSFSGSENFNAGIDYQLALHDIQFFGEAGLSKSLKPGGIQGIVWHAHPQISIATCYRYFDSGFHTFYGSSLSESSGNRNETGFYTGVMLYPLPKMKISCYVDIYHFPWLTYSTMSPGSGYDYMAQVDIALSRKFSLYIKGKYESKPQKTSISTGVVADYDEMTTKLRIHTEYIVNEKLTLRSRFEYAGYSFNDTHEDGFLVFQDIIYAPFRRLNLWFRYAWFNTDGYNSRIYTYENDLLYSFSIPEFHGKGHRIYLNLKWSPVSRITTYLKAGCTIHEGVSSWGSGNDATSGNK
ncbi:MAG: helix-hairpin-helix domain-containing protein [Bacteroidia bacterium]|nr:helix-hairpin-helix domain-containing protein [Bacteroidia bacterium]